MAQCPGPFFQAMGGPKPLWTSSSFGPGPTGTWRGMEVLLHPNPRGIGRRWRTPRVGSQFIPTGVLMENSLIGISRLVGRADPKNQGGAPFLTLFLGTPKTPLVKKPPNWNPLRVKSNWGPRQGAGPRKDPNFVFLAAPGKKNRPPPLAVPLGQGRKANLAFGFPKGILFGRRVKGPLPGPSFQPTIRPKLAQSPTATSCSKLKPAQANNSLPGPSMNSGPAARDPLSTLTAGALLKT